jgi:hypothetical protein
VRITCAEGAMQVTLAQSMINVLATITAEKLNQKALPGPCVFLPRVSKRTALRITNAKIIWCAQKIKISETIRFSNVI